MTRLILLGTAIAEHGFHRAYIVNRGTIKYRATIAQLKK